MTRERLEGMRDRMIPWITHKVKGISLPNYSESDKEKVREELEELFDLAVKALEQKPRWIPVSERLPEENRTVIASAEYGFYPEARYTKEDGWEWAYESGADYWVEIESDVLAWMPLPKPYKPQESEE